MSKHPYNPECTCTRCVREFHRRMNQSNSDPRTVAERFNMRPTRSRAARRERAFHEWAANDDGPGAYELEGGDQ